MGIPIGTDERGVVGAWKRKWKVPGVGLNFEAVNWGMEKTRKATILCRNEGFRVVGAEG